jgi:Uncharacterized homolog of phage Mu protein gp47
MAISDLIFVDQSGLHYPDYPTVLTYLQGEYRTIYGADTYLEADSQDGQWVAILALAMFDSMQVAAAVYNSFSPLTAQKDALSRNVKINGIARLVASYSTADLTIVGQPGTTIVNGQAKDTLDQKWNLPASVTIPVGGSIVVTATAEQIGAVSAAAGTINKIATPTLGWQTVNNVAAATIGDPVETDAELRRRQAQSTMIPSLSVMEGIVGAVASLAGVNRYRGYENDTGTANADGVPAHAISLVVEGGTTQAIAEAIAAKKTPGTATYGTTSYTTYDQYGVPNIINFFRPTAATISVEVSLTARTGYLSTTAAAIKAAVVDYIDNLLIGDDIYISKLYVPANLSNTVAADTFDVTQIRIKKNAGSWVTTNLTLAFNEIAQTDLANVTVIAV